MKLFQHIPPDADHHSIQTSLKALTNLARATGGGNGTRWRLAQLELDDEDRAWLDAWAKQLKAATAAFWLQADQPTTTNEAKLSHAACIGSLLLLAATEYARRGLPQTAGWAIPTAHYFSAEARTLLYRGDEPSPAHLRALRLAVQKLCLHSGRAENSQAWLRETIALQVGKSGDPTKDFPRWIPATLAQLENAPLDPLQPAGQAFPPSPSPAVYPDDIFRELEARAGAATIVAAAETMLKRALQKGLAAQPWSLAELGPTDYDFIWLRVWLKRLDASTVRYCQSPFRRFAALGQDYPSGAGLGLLLLFWVAEHARRRAEEGTLWRWIPQTDLPPEVRSLLFNNGQPTQALKELLELAARRFQLRHVFGLVGMQQWLDTVFLQFGFTRRGFERRLPEWLTGQTNLQALQRLLHPETGSRSFQAGWETLRSFRRHEITATQARRQLAGNPWFLPEWLEPILALAQERIQPSEAAETNAIDDVPATFLTAPLFCWDPPAQPYFSCRLVDLEDFDLHDDCYELLIRNDGYATLLRQPDGSYAQAVPVELRLPFDQPTATARLLGRSGQLAASMELEFWPAGEDVAIFQLTTGKRLADAYNDLLNPQTSYALLLAEDLTLHPAAPVWQTIGQMKLCLLPRGWDVSTRVYLDDCVLWEPILKPAGAANEPVWSQQVYLPLNPTNSFQWGEHVQLDIQHPPEIAVRFVRCGGQPLDFQPRSERRTSFKLKIQPAWPSNRVLLQIGLKRPGQSWIVRRTIDLPILGVRKRKQGVWRALSERFVLNLEKAAASQFAINPPRRWEGTEPDIQEWALMEGDTWVRRLRPRPFALGALTGLGAPLTMRLGPYNAAREALTIAQQVIDTGLISEAKVKDGALQLHLLRRLEPDAAYRVLWWDVNGTLHELPARLYESFRSHCRWHCELPRDLPPFIAVALAYAGCRLGAWWQPEWGKLLADVSAAGPAPTAALLRWLRLPLLAEDALTAVRAAVAEHPALYLREWLREGAELEALQPGAITEGWLAAVRTIFNGLHFNPAQAGELLEQLSADAPADEPLAQAAWKLLNVDPLLLVRVLRPWLEQQPDCSAAQQQLRALRLQIAEAKDQTECTRQYQQLLAESAQVWDVDAYFIRRSILECAREAMAGQPLARRDEMNLALAVTLEPLRRLLALDLLDELLKRGGI